MNGPASGACSATGSTICFMYNAHGQRIEKWAATYRQEYVYHPDGRELGTFDGNGNGWWARNVMYGNRAVAIYVGNEIKFLHANHLNTTTMVTNGAGTVLQEQLFDPWGVQWTYGGAQHDLHFASLHQIDPDLGTYPTPTRNYLPRIYRWLVPDPEDASAFENPDDPQSWNGYAYVRNNPVNLTDPSGEAYEVCQTNEQGMKTNCTILTDEQFAQFQKANQSTLVFSDGKISVFNPGEGKRQIGTFRDLGPDLKPEVAAALDRAAAIGAAGVRFGAEMVVGNVVGGVGGAALGWTVGRVLPHAETLALGARGAFAGRALPALTRLSPKIQRQMVTRGWTRKEIIEAFDKGQRFPAVDRTAGGAPATRYVHPATGKYVVINDVTGNVIQVSKVGFIPH